MAKKEFYREEFKKGELRVKYDSESDRISIDTNVKEYSSYDSKIRLTVDQAKAVSVLLNKLEVIKK